MVALLGAMTLMLSFFHDLGDVFRDPKSRALLIWVAILLIVGTIFYSLTEGWHVVDAFYFSVITLTTVGFGDFSPTTTVGKLFTVIYIFWGLSIIVAFTNVLTKKHAQRIVARANNRAGASLTIAAATTSADQETGQNG
jgi:voltage-gated potassium channel